MRSTTITPNKPMVPTATIWFDEYAPGSLRRHIGRPLGADSERRATEEQTKGQE